MSSIITDPQRIDAILERGTITEALPTMDRFRERLLDGEQLTFYIGFDATAPTLHLSHAKNFLLLEKFRQLGHRVIVLFGDFTARIGDPTGEASARTQLTREDVLENVKQWKELIAPLMDFDATDNPPEIKYNSEWLAALTFEDVIALSSNFTVQQMLERDMFQKRLKEEQPIHLHEFFYPLMQGYDSVAMDVDVELCGTDQTFNALTGRTLLRKLKNKEKLVVTVTLMENPITGEMMSKSKGTGVFLGTTPEDMYGQIMSQPDEMIEILFTHCTNHSLEDIKALDIAANPRDTKMKLARDIVALFHGDEASISAEQHFISTIQQKQIPDEMPEMIVSESSLPIVELLFRSELVSSKSDARRMVEQGGVKIDGEPVRELLDIDISSDGFVLQKGKRHFIRVCPQ